MTYIFSSDQNMFYPLVLKADYVAVGSWPDDGIQVSENLFREFTGPKPEGKTRGVGPDGMPVWINAPVLEDPETTPE
ncbi:hypothetical protein [Kluyvera intermedia]|uniref:hypothetical protein n=1 Tax=Kluyvera intermedia TaxID=61648 RepID=UPI0039F596FF